MPSRHFSIPPAHIPFRAAVILKNRLGKPVPPFGNIFNPGNQQYFAAVPLYQAGCRLHVNTSAGCIFIRQAIGQFTAASEHIHITPLEIPADSPDRIFVGNDNVIITSALLILLQQGAGRFHFNGQFGQDKVGGQKQKERRKAEVYDLFSVRFGDGGNPSPSGEEKVIVVALCYFTDLVHILRRT